MADDNAQRRLDPEATAAPNRDRRGEPPIIEGDAATEQSAASAGGEEPQRGSSPPGDSAASADSKARSRSLAGAAIGGLAGAIVAAAALWFESGDVDALIKQRLAVVDAPIADLTRRVAALEAAAQNAASAADAAKAAQTDSQAARSDAAKALALASKAASTAEQKKEAPAISPTDLSALSERVKKLESAPREPPQSAGTSADIAALQERLGKVEAALAAPKNETRVAPENGPGRKDWTGLAVAAEAVAARLAAGAPYAAEESALERLGADPAKIAALKPFAEHGAPTAEALAARFAQAAPHALEAVAPKESGGVIDRLMSNMSRVVKITPVGATPGDDPAALLSQIAAALDRGDIGAAMALWSRLPEPARKASQDWAAAARARLAADAAAQDILNDAMAKLAAADKQ
ncbi:MAG TPA: hypothetical protein VKV96_17615 [Roseiarcus sp.]|nr:hypothetical protein [Roseiarcus sp.]